MAKTSKSATLHPPRADDSDSDDAPEEFSSSIPQKNSRRSPSPKPVSNSKNLKTGSRETGVTSRSQSPKKQLKPARSRSRSRSPKGDGQPVATLTKKGQPFTKEEDDLLYAFCQRHRDVARADAPYKILKLCFQFLNFES
jgi:hypothetical protein